MLVALAFVLAVWGLLTLIRRTVYVATAAVTYTPVGGVEQHVPKGSLIPESATALVLAEEYRKRSLSLLRFLIVGKDNRVSTSKTVMFAWTFAIVWGLVATMLAYWRGDTAGWTALQGGLQEEYLILLGGPYAAAVLAKYKATADAEGEAGKTVAPVGTAAPSQLVADDRGEGDIGDLQYVLFNFIALVWFVVTLIRAFDEGFPDVPPLLAGLALTSATGYSAKKLISQAGPQITAVQPTAAWPTTATLSSQVEVLGRNLVVPADVAPGGTALAPTVDIGGFPAEVASTTNVLGTDRVTVKVPQEVTPGPVKVTAVRADGVAATGPHGTDSVTLTIRQPPAAPL
ncbi:hypothetical protein [Solirubrobacter pauli]|nr:hypothetical protein [Solirubrobacter pauli]